MEPDIHKDSNMTVTMICMGLEYAKKMLAARSLTMPLHIVFQADNTCQENKNNVVITFCALLVALGLFKSVTMHFHRVGHTHGPVDQRFSVLASVVAINKVLQTISDFVAAVVRGMKGAHRRDLFCDVCTGSYDWQNWLWCHLGIATPGLTPNPWSGELHTNHAWKLCRRCDLPDMDQPHGHQWVCKEMTPSCPKDEHDVVLLLKA